MTETFLQSLAGQTQAEALQTLQAAGMAWVIYETDPAIPHASPAFGRNVVRLWVRDGKVILARPGDPLALVNENVA